MSLIDRLSRKAARSATEECVETVKEKTPDILEIALGLGLPLAGLGIFAFVLRKHGTDARTTAQFTTNVTVKIAKEGL